VEIPSDPFCRFRVRHVHPPINPHRMTFIIIKTRNGLFTKTKFYNENSDTISVFEPLLTQIFYVYICQYIKQGYLSLYRLFYLFSIKYSIIDLLNLESFPPKYQSFVIVNVVIIEKGSITHYLQNCPHNYYSFLSKFVLLRISFLIKCHHSSQSQCIKRTLCKL